MRQRLLKPILAGRGIQKRQALGKTPAEAADIAPLIGFKWLELLKFSTTRRETADKSQTASTR
jgi:hypothetical protein